MRLQDTVNIWVYTFCYNEMHIIPYVMEYWHKLASKVIVYDNMSSDGSYEFLSAFPDFIEVRRFDTGNVYNPDRQMEIKNTCWKEAAGKCNYVWISDMDEVPGPGFEEAFIKAKQSSSPCLYGNYWQTRATNEIPYYSGRLIHQYKETQFLRTYRPICVAFNPSAITEIQYGNYQRTCAFDRIKTNDVRVNVLHLKYINYTWQQSRHLDNMRRCGIGRAVAYEKFYGKTLADYIAIYNQTINDIKFPCREKLICDQPYSCEICTENTGWRKEDKIDGKRNKTSKCIIVIPIYKIYPEPYEVASIKQTVKVLGDEFDICLVHPDFIDPKYYDYVGGNKFRHLSVPDWYFTGIAQYSALCETSDFYQAFDEYEYMLICQIDAWIFENDVKKFIDMGYDYIGSPWIKDMVIKGAESVGNGGFCLRNIAKFKQICKNLDLSQYDKHDVDLEDIFFCKDLKHLLNIAPVSEAMKFAWTSDMDYWLEQNGGKLPMACHAFHRQEYWYWWKNHIKDCK